MNYRFALAQVEGTSNVLLVNKIHVLTSLSLLDDTTVSDNISPATVLNINHICNFEYQTTGTHRFGHIEELSDSVGRVLD